MNKYIQIQAKIKLYRQTSTYVNKYEQISEVIQQYHKYQHIQVNINAHQHISKETEYQQIPTHVITHIKNYQQRSTTTSKYQ